jgi:hypothetical protein
MVHTITSANPLYISGLNRLLTKTTGLCSLLPCPPPGTQFVSAGAINEHMHVNGIISQVLTGRQEKA